MVLHYSVVKRLPGLRLIPPGVKVDRDRRPRWLSDVFTPYVRMRSLTTPSPDMQLITTKKRQPLRMKTSEPDAKRPTRIPRPQQDKLP